MKIVERTITLPTSRHPDFEPGALRVHDDGTVTARTPDGDITGTITETTTSEDGLTTTLTIFGRLSDDGGA